MSYVTRQRCCIDCGDPCSFKRCAACAHAALHTDLHGADVTYGERIAVQCWCERTSVWVPMWMFREGLTASCGAENCRRAA